MANGSRAWQRSLKNGKTEVYAAVDGCASVRMIGDGPDCLRLIECFEEITGVALRFGGPPPVIEGQTDLYEHLDAA